MPRLDEPLSIRQLEVFVALVRTGSFTAAARQLGLSQSTVSGHVADLERRLGGQVVERSRRGVTTTAVGHALLPPARETLRAERTTRTAVEELTGLLRGVLSIGASTIPTTWLLPAWCAAFHASYPDIRIRIETGDSQTIRDHVLGSGVDLGLVGAAPTEDGLSAVQVAGDALVLIVPPGHGLAELDAVTPEQVMECPFVLREEGSGTRAATLAMLEEAGARSAVDRLDVVCEIGSTEGTKAAVRAGLGVAFVSDLAVAEEVAAGSLVTVPVAGCDTRRAFYLIERKGGWLGPAARAFKEGIGVPA